MSETILSLSEFKADPSRLLDNIHVEPTRLVLTQNGRARAVVEDYEQHQERQRAHFIDVQPRLNVVWHCYAGTADPHDNHAVADVGTPTFLRGRREISLPAWQ